MHMSLLLLLVRYALLTILQYCFLILDFCICLLAAPGKYSESVTLVHIRTQLEYETLKLYISRHIY
jgi:hypothetical protein